MSLTQQPKEPLLRTTPGALRARLTTLGELLNQCRADSQEFWRIQQRMAVLERELQAMDEANTSPR
jgi:uncharacterized protein involved in exopolysaccharide biosynthesis